MKTEQTGPLTSKQKSRLAILARMAFRLSIQRGAVDDTADYDAWRYEQTGQAVGVASQGWRESTQGQYRLIRGRFFVILGNAEAAFEDFMQGGEENELRRQRLHRLAAAVGSLAEFWRAEKSIGEDEASRQAWAYALSIARDKAGGRALSALDAAELAQLGFTIINRCNAKRGVGSAANRNKSQRIKAEKTASQETGNEPASRLPIVQTSVQAPEIVPDCLNLGRQGQIASTP